MPAEQHTQPQQSLGQLKLGRGGNGKRPPGSRLVLPEPVPGSQSRYLLTAVRKLLQPMPGQCPTSCASSRNGLKWHKTFCSRLFPWSIRKPGYGRELRHSAGGGRMLWSRQGQAGAGGHAQPRLPAHTSGDRGGSVSPDDAERRGIRAMRSSGSRNPAPVCKPLHTYL